MTDCDPPAAATAAAMVANLITAVRTWKEQHDKQQQARKKKRKLTSLDEQPQQRQPPPITPPAAIILPPNPIPARLSMLTRLLDITQHHPQYPSLYLTSNLEPLQCALLPHHNSTTHHHILALDCEMIQTTLDDMALARVSVVEVFDYPFNTTPRTMLDRLVRPRGVLNKDFVVDTRFHVTGITVDELFGNNVLSWDAARTLVRDLMTPSTILVGHALHHDLLALGFTVLPSTPVIDTSLLFAVENDPIATHGLQYLSRIALGRDAGTLDRVSRGGVHDSIEDAAVSLKIVTRLLDANHHTIFPIELPRRRAKAENCTETGILGSVASSQVQLWDSITTQSFVDKTGLGC